MQNPRWYHVVNAIMCMHTFRRKMADCMYGLSMEGVPAIKQFQRKLFDLHCLLSKWQYFRTNRRSRDGMWLNRQTQRPNYRNPRCACAPRVSQEDKTQWIVGTHLIQAEKNNGSCLLRCPDFRGHFVLIMVSWLEGFLLNQITSCILQHVTVAFYELVPVDPDFRQLFISQNSTVRHGFKVHLHVWHHHDIIV